MSDFIPKKKDFEFNDKKFICAMPSCQATSRLYFGYNNFINIDKIICFYKNYNHFCILVDFGSRIETMYISEFSYNYLLKITL